jgi:ubiquinone/menaquinone biosynthesis C-methylase UbiE
MNERRLIALHDPIHVAEQYRDDERLRARMRLYQTYGEPGRASFASWVFDAIDWPASARVFEVGCGTGDFWLQNIERIPEGVQITLSDASAAMVDRARVSLGPRGSSMNFETVDVLRVPHGDASFDLLIANHMLYHVADRARALRELHRVLRPGGRLYVTTNAWTHLLELRDVCERFCDASPLLPARYLEGAFDVENAARELQQLFADVTVRSRFSAMNVDDPSVLAEYVRSMIPRERPMAIERLRDHLEWRIALEGRFRVTAAGALLIARRA